MTLIVSGAIADSQPKGVDNVRESDKNPGMGIWMYLVLAVAASSSSTCSSLRSSCVRTLGKHSR